MNRLFIIVVVRVCGLYIMMDALSRLDQLYHNAGCQFYGVAPIIVTAPPLPLLNFNTIFLIFFIILMQIV